MQAGRVEPNLSTYTVWSRVTELVNLVDADLEVECLDSIPNEKAGCGWSIPCLYLL